ncbi:hypothetical protein [Methylobacterium sp. ID0610]|uniref:hypothetical protein n=1 Tax=Methylobacterium carpenticola TaxID=3344827 RepID=UPI0036A2A7EE
MLPVLVGVVGLAVDASIWIGEKNATQGVADHAALSAVVAVAAGADPSQAAAEALAVAAASGFADGRNTVSVTVNNPPASGAYAGKANAYEVIIARVQDAYFSRLIGLTPTVSSRAVAMAGGMPACILALDRSAQAALDLSGTASINAPACGVAANSSSPQAVSLSGNASIRTAALTVAGDYAISGNAGIRADRITRGAAVADPYAGLAVPRFSGCDQTTAYALKGGTARISPGVYCGGIAVSSGGTLILDPGSTGLYIINGGDLTVSSGTLNASGVSIVLTSTTGNWGKVTVSGNGRLNLSANPSGPLQGVAIYADRAAPASMEHAFSGGADFSVSGSLYMPSGRVTFSGGSSAEGGCTQLIARLITVSGGASFGRNCGSLTVPGLRSTSKGLPVE